MIGFVGLYENEEASHEEEPLDIYLHGYVSSRLMKLGGTSPVEEHEGFPVTIAVSFCNSTLSCLNSCPGFNSRSDENSEDLLLPKKTTLSTVIDHTNRQLISTA